MSSSKLVAEVEKGLKESQNQRDARVEQLWARLSPGGVKELDLKALQKGFRRIDHRMGNPLHPPHPLPSTLPGPDAKYVLQR